MEEGESKEHKDRPYWLPVVIAFGMWLWLTYLYLTPDAVDKTQFTFNTWKNIGYLVIIIMLAWLFIWKITLSTEVAAEPIAETIEEVPKKLKVETPPASKEPVKKRPKRVVVKAPAAAASAKVEATRKEEVEPEEEEEDLLPEDLEVEEEEEEEEEELRDLPRVVEWEKKEPGGVYSDTLIRVDENLVLNLRTLLGKVCHNCEELDDCRRRVAGKLDEDVFLYNFECKEGLKKELHKARKMREAEKEKADAAKDLVEEKAAKAKKTSTKKKTSKKKTSKKKAAESK